MSKKRPAPPPTSPGGDDAPLSRDALMDSLPYVDLQNEDYEQYALALIEEEMKNTVPPPDKAIPPIRFRTIVMEREYTTRYEEAIGSGASSTPAPMDLDFLKNSKASPPSSSDDKNNVEEWRTAVQRARTDYETERLRGIVLDVKKDTGAALLWKGFNGNLDQDLQALNRLLKDQRELVERINLQRSEDQQVAGKQIQILTQKYQEALERRFRLQQATRILEEEIKQMP